jgi:hypothetical protein
MAVAIGLAFLGLLGLGWLVGRLTRPPKLNRVSDGWLQQNTYDRGQQRPD